MENLDRPSRQTDYRLEKMENELLLFDPGNNKILYCNETATLIWQLCDGQRNIQEITDLLAGAYPEAVDTMAEDVKSVIEMFQQHGAVRLV